MKNDYLFINVSEKFEELEKVSDTVIQDKTDKIGWETFFHQLPKDQLEVFVCLYMGFEPSEIVELLNLKNLARFYNLNARLKKSYRAENWRIFEYG